MRLVVLESPYAGDVPYNVRYAQHCMADCLKRGEAPFASHLLYTQPHVLNDRIQSDRQLGMAAGFAWGRVADAVVVYTDLGISEGMREGIARAEAAGQAVEHRQLGGVWQPGSTAKSRSAVDDFKAAQAMLSHAYAREGGVMVDLHGRQAPTPEQFLKGSWQRVKTGEIDSDQGVAVAWKATDSSRAAQLLNRKVITYRQYFTAEYLHLLHRLAGIDQKVTPGYGEATGRAEATYGMAPSERAHDARKRLREVRIVMGSLGIPVGRSNTPVMAELYPVVMRLVLEHADLADCGRFICDNNTRLPRWNKTRATYYGREAIYLGLDRAADHWRISVREDD